MNTESATKFADRSQNVRFFFLLQPQKGRIGRPGLSVAQINTANFDVPRRESRTPKTGRRPRRQCFSYKAQRIRIISSCASLNVFHLNLCAFQSIYKPIDRLTHEADRLKND